MSDLLKGLSDFSGSGLNHVKEYTNVKAKELLRSDSAFLPKLRDDFIAKLENALMVLSWDDINLKYSEAEKQVYLKTFDGAWLSGESLRHKKDEEFMLAPFGDDQVHPSMFPDMNIKLLQLNSDSIVMLNKFKFLSMKDKRHLYKKYRFMYSQTSSYLDYGKKTWMNTGESGFGFNGYHKTKKEENKMFLPMPVSLNKKYVLDQLGTLSSYMDDENMTSYEDYVRDLHVALQLNMTYYYEWSCYIKEKPTSLGVRIPIHPSSSKEIFLMRNIPEGAKRRKAIVNYVKDHYRTIKGHNDNERKVLIKKHFRGELKFNWRGLEVHVTPSQYDLNRVKTTKNFLKL